MNKDTTDNGCFRGGTTYEDSEREVHAFPIVVPHDFRFAADGMTLRDYFAGQVISSSTEGVTEEYLGLTATYAYKIADAMMKARETKTV